MKVFITGGGTVGHVSPAIAVAKELKKAYKKKITIKYIGLKDGVEKNIALSNKIEFIGIDSSGITSRKIIPFIKIFMKILSGIVESYFILKKERPDIVIGFGGYVSFPIIFVAQKLGIKTYIHEQNAFFGKTNFKLFKKASLVFLSHKNTKNIDLNSNKVVYTGNPVKDEFFSIMESDAKNKLKCKDDVFYLISLGGSGGAKKINDLMYEVIKHFNNSDKIKITHITGKSYYEKFKKIAFTEGVKFGENIEILSFTEDMAYYFNAYDLVISRSGASTISEIEATGINSILIPSPNVTDNHQEFNARSVENSIVILEKDLSYPKVIAMIEDYLINKPSKKAVDSNNSAKIIVEKIRKDFLN